MCLRYAFVLPSFCLRFRFAPIDGASTDLQRLYNGLTTNLQEGVESSRRISLKPVLILEMALECFSCSFLKDNVNIVIDIENNGIIVTRAFSRLYIIFQAYRIR